MGKIDENLLTTKQKYAECFLSELCDYLDSKKYAYRVIYRSWIDGEDLPISYDQGRYQTRCDLAIFLLVDQERLHFFFNFKVNQFAYKLEVRSGALFRDTKNGIRKRDPDYELAHSLVREDKNAVYCFVLKNTLPNNDENNYKKRILTCNFQNKAVTVGAAIRNLLEQRKKPNS